MDLQVAAVDAVVVGDHHLRELDVLVLERLEHAVELLDDQVEAAERVRLELAAAAAGSARGPAACAGAAAAARRRRGPARRRAVGAQPNLPVTYSSVRGSLGLVKISCGRADLDELAVEHERGAVGDARGLLHVVGDDHDRHALLELVDQLLDLQRRDRVERRAGLVHQDHLGFDRERARDAQPLLLAAREARRRARAGGRRPRPTGRRCAAPPRPCACRSPRLRRAEAQAGGDVVEDRHRRERVGLLEDHADRAAHRDDVDRGVVDVEVVEQHPALGARAGDLLVHAVDAAHHRRLAAARRADDRGHLVGAEVEVDALDLFGVAVEGAQLLERHADGRLLGARARGGAPAGATLAVLSCAGGEAGRSGSAACSAAGCRAPRQSRARVGLVGCHARRLLREIRRAMRLSSRIMTTRVSAAPQARFDHGGGRRGDVVVDLHGQRVHEPAEVEVGLRASPPP